MPPTPVKVSETAYSNVNDSETYLGTLKSRQTVDLYSEVTGKVQTINFKSGDRVGKGSLLASLRADEEESSLNAQMALAQSKSQTVYSRQSHLSEAKANLDYAKNQYERQKKLYEQDLISKNQLETYQNNLDKAKNTYNSISYDAAGAKDDYKQSTLQIGEKRARLNKLRITAPFAGIVQDIPVKVGDLVQPQTIRYFRLRMWTRWSCTLMFRQSAFHCLKKAL